MQVGVILVDFAPDITVAGWTVRWETVALAGTILLTVALAAFIAGRASGDGAGPLPPSTERARRAAADSLEATQSLAEARLRMPGFTDAGSLGGSATARADVGSVTREGIPPPTATLSQVDLLVIVLAALPGAIVGGRIGYVLTHFDYYVGHPSAIIDPGQGSLELGLATVGGTMTALIVAHGLQAPIGRWLHVAALPVLVGLALGKLAMALSADGQGVPSDAPWATAYSGPGPWGSLAPQVPSHPAQIYEGGLTLVAVLLLLILFAAGRFKAQDGRAFFAAICLWAVVRIGVAFVWRDPTILGPLRAGQLVAAAIAAVSLALWLVQPRLVGWRFEPPDR